MHTKGNYNPVFCSLLDELLKLVHNACGSLKGAEYMGQRMSPMTGEVARLFVLEAERNPRRVIRGYNLTLSARARTLGGDLVEKDSDNMCQWIPPRASEFFLLGSFSRGEVVHGIPLCVDKYYLLRLRGGKELFVHVSENTRGVEVAVAPRIPNRVVGAILKRIGTALCEGRAPVLMRE